MTQMIPEEKIAEIKAKAKIVEVISDFVSLKKAGKNYLGLCPFHSERTPSFTVNEEKGFFHCFGCGAGGNLFTFLMRIHNLSFPEVARELAKRYGIALPQRELSPEEKRLRTLKGKLYEINELAAEYYERVLASKGEGEEGRQYLAQRGISGDTIAAHRLGFAPAGWDFLLTYLQGKGVPLNLAESVGLIQLRQDRSGYFDRFRQRVIFPIINEGGKVIGFGGRIMPSADSSAPKYMNSSESPVYAKGQTLYGLNAAKEAIREQGHALIVEGYMDLLSLCQEGFRNVVASLGTSLTSAQVDLLMRYAREITLIFDGDEGGRKATQRSLDIFLSRGVPAKVAALPDGFDPDSFIRDKRAEGFSVILKEALPVVDYMLEQATRNFSRDTVEGKAKIAREMIPVLNQIGDPIERNLYIERICHRLGIKESLIRNQLKGGKSTVEGAAPEPPSSPGPAYERVLLHLMLLNGDVVPKVQEVLGSEGFSSPLYRTLGREIAGLWQAAGEVDPQALLSRVAQEEVKSLISELLLEEECIVDPGRMLSDCLRQFRLNRILKEIKSVDDEIRQRSQAKGEPAATSGLQELLRRKLRLKAEQKKWMESAFGLQPPGGAISKEKVGAYGQRR